MRMFAKLWKDEVGAVVSAELVLVATTVLLGLIVGLATLRDGINNELADVAQAIDDLDQSYEISGILGHSAATAQSVYSDLNDFCDDAGTAAEHCISITSPTAVPDGDDDRA